MFLGNQEPIGCLSEGYHIYGIETSNPGCLTRLRGPGRHLGLGEGPQSERLMWIWKGKTSKHTNKSTCCWIPKIAFSAFWSDLFIEPVVTYISSLLLSPFKDWEGREKISLQTRTHSRWSMLQRSPNEDQTQGERLRIICFKMFAELIWVEPGVGDCSRVGAARKQNVADRKTRRGKISCCLTHLILPQCTSCTVDVCKRKTQKEKLWSSPLMPNNRHMTVN